MLGRRKKYEYNYWGNESTYMYRSPKKPARSFARKLAIVFSFVFILAITPPLLLSISSLDLTPTKKVSLIEDSSKIKNEAPKSYPVTVELPSSEPTTSTEPTQADSNYLEVINNDSYWKISVRSCGTGKYYLSIRTQNGAKALYKGDSVIANCTF